MPCLQNEKDRVGGRQTGREREGGGNRLADRQAISWVYRAKK